MIFLLTFPRPCIWKVENSFLSRHQLIGLNRTLSTSIRSPDPHLRLDHFSNSLLHRCRVVRSGSGSPYSVLCTSSISTFSVSRSPTRRSSRWWGRSLSHGSCLCCVLEACNSHRLLDGHINKRESYSLAALCSYIIVLVLIIHIH